MTITKQFCAAVSTAVVFTAGTCLAPANVVNGTTAAGSLQAPASKAALLKLERSAYDARKFRDANFWDTFLSDNFVGWGRHGKLDKASAKREFSGVDCEIKRYALSKEQMTPIGIDAALITYKVNLNRACDGTAISADSWAVALYVRDDNGWKEAFHAEAAVVDPKASPVAPNDNSMPNAGTLELTHLDTATEAMIAYERTIWETWRMHDNKALGQLMAKEFSFINMLGAYYPTKSDALKMWSEGACDVKSIGIYDATGTIASPTVSLLSYKVAADDQAICDGEKLGPIWDTSIYVKNGSSRKWIFSITLPAN